MTSRLAVTVILLIALAAGIAHAAEPEFRAIQVHHWIDGGLSADQIDKTIKWAKDANFNIIQYQVRRVGDAYYDSAYEPRATIIKGPVDFDPFAYVIKKAHQNGLEVHAWINVCRIWAAPDPPADPKHVVNKHPEWLSKNSKGGISDGRDTFLDPGAPGVREYLVKIVDDILTKYDVDGIMLDYIRYPSRNYGYNDASLAAFNAKNGSTGQPAETDAKWSQWRRDQVTQTVRAIYKEINRVKPWVKLSAATIVWGGCADDFKNTEAYASVFQDWQGWMKEGILDINLPMNYKDPSDPNHQKMYTGWLDGMKRWEYNRRTACTVWVSKGNIDGAIGQIKEARDKGLDIVGFAFSQVDNAAALGKKLKATVFKTPAPVPKLSWKPERKATEPAK